MKIVEDFKERGITISAIYYSPFRSVKDNFTFKPNPGMIFEAKKDLNIDLSQSYFIGDQYLDYICAINASLSPLIVKTGNYKINAEVDLARVPEEVKFKNLHEVCDEIIRLDQIKKSEKIKKDIKDIYVF